MKTKLKFYEIFLFINVYTILLSWMIEEVLKLHNIKAYVMVFTLKLVLQSYVLLNIFFSCAWAYNRKNMYQNSQIRKFRRESEIHVN